MKQLLKIDLTNPITHEEVKRMIQKILDVSNPGLLLIDFGNHDFESLEVLKFCKEEFNRIQSVLLMFSKIAIVTIPPFKSESGDFEKLQYFYSAIDAKEWLST